MTAKVKTIVEMSAPRDVLGIWSFLRPAGYYRWFVPNFSNLAKPLNEQTEANTPYVWTPARQHAFDSIKSALTESPILRAPDFDRHSGFILTGPRRG